MVRRPKLPGETLFGFVMLVLGLALLWQSHAISGFSALSSPGAFPMAASATMVIAALIVVLGDRRRPSAGSAMASTPETPSPRILPLVVAVLIVAVAIYALLLDTLGFLPASFVFLFAMMHYLWRRSILKSFVVALGSLILIYVVFRLVFQVVLPEGVVPEREIMAWIENSLTSGGDK